MKFLINFREDDLIYTLDNESRIIDVNDGSEVISQYSYDRLGRRISKTTGGVTTCFAYDQFGNVIAEYQKDGNDVTWQKDYVYGAKGELVYMQLHMTAEASEAGDDFISFCEAWLCYPDCDTNELDWDYNNDDDITFVDFTAHVNDFSLAFANNGRYILTDFTNSVIGIADSNSLTQITYNAWGTPSCSGDLDGLNILWNGYYYDDETDNYYLRNRYYSPLERKFITPDPRGINPDENWNNRFAPMTQTANGTALGVYCQGDPINYQDYWGLMSDYAFFHDFMMHFALSGGRLWTRGADVIKRQNSVKDDIAPIIRRWGRKICLAAAARARGPITGKVSGRIFDTQTKIFANDSLATKLTLNGVHRYYIDGSYYGEARCPNTKNGYCLVMLDLKHEWNDAGDLHLEDWPDDWPDYVMEVYRKLNLLHHLGWQYQDFPIKINWSAFNKMEKFGNLSLSFTESNLSGWPFTE